MTAIAGQVWNFAYTGAQQTFTAPATGVYTLSVTGAVGGTGNGSNLGAAGNGAKMQANFSLQAGDTLYVNVGGKGTANSASTGSVSGGWNGGGGVVGSGGNWGTGGGMTDIRLNGTAITNALVIGGGGGAGGYSSGTGGHAGYPSGAMGTNGSSWASGRGGGATQTAGGTAGTGYTSSYGTVTAGSQGQGGVGAGDSAGGGGGGGGWYGGGGGIIEGGGGGSSYYASSATSPTYDATGTNSTSDGSASVTLVSINPPPAPAWTTQPSSGQTIQSGANVSLAWTASPPSGTGDTITYTLKYSTNAGSSWTQVVSELTSTSYTWTTPSAVSSTQVVVQIQAFESNGTSSATTNSNTFSLGSPSIPTFTTQPSKGQYEVIGSSTTVAWSSSTPFTAGDSINYNLYFKSLAYKSAVLWDTPVAYYRLNEASGTSVSDSSGNGHTGTITGTVTYAQAGATADGDTSMGFDGSTAYVQLPSAVDVASPLSIEAWVYPTTFGSSEGVFVVAADPGPRLAINPNGKPFANLQVNGGWQTTLVSSVTIALNTWHHLVTTVNGTTQCLYVDGNLVAQETVSSGSVTYNSSTPFVIGADNFTSSPYHEFFGGRIDEVAIYNYALTEYQVTSHYQVGTSIASDSTTTIATGLTGTSYGWAIPNSPSPYTYLYIQANESNGLIQDSSPSNMFAITAYPAPLTPSWVTANNQTLYTLTPTFTANMVPGTKTV